MLCRHPYVRDRSGSAFASPHPKDWLAGVPFRCGKCLACRKSIRAEWTTRLIFEMLKSHAGAFVTLTYSEDYVPVTESGFRTLSKRDLQLFMKRLRINLERKKKCKYPIRFFACGEYGTQGTQRPHYHILIFGAHHMDRDFIECCQNAWREPARPGLAQGDTPMFGSVSIEPLNDKSIAYTSGYVTKKLIAPVKKHKVIVSSVDVGSKRYTFDKLVVDRANSDRDTDGVLAEFRTMSRMPGLGTGFAFDLVALWRSNAAFRHALYSAGDIPTRFRAFGRWITLDRLMRSRLRELLNVTPNSEAYYADVRNQFFTWLDDTGIDHSTDFYTYLVKQDDQRYRQLEARIKLQLQGRKKL